MAARQTVLVTSTEATAELPILFLDVDGVISLFGFDRDNGPELTFANVDGSPHWIATAMGPRLARLLPEFEVVWATGWEERANEHLPFVLGLKNLVLPVVSFDGRAQAGAVHWKLEAIDEYAGNRPAAWVDDNLDAECERWAASRGPDTLLVQTDPAVGLVDSQVGLLLRWAARLARSRGAVA